jgi:hypothetical protein
MLDVTSDANETRFTFSMPVAAAERADAAETPAPPHAAGLRSQTREIIETARSVGNNWVDTVEHMAESLSREIESLHRDQWPSEYRIDKTLNALARAHRFLQKTNASSERLSAIQTVRERLLERLQSPSFPNVQFLTKRPIR